MYYAHSGTPGSTDDWQKLRAHLFATARLAAEMGRPLGLEAAAGAAGLFHDLGKYTAEFQRRLAGADVRVDHSTAGALAMLGDLTTGLDKGIAELIAYAIAGHHAGLPDRKNETPACLERRRELKLPALDPVWKAEIGDTVRGIVPEFVRNYPSREAQAFGLSVMGRMIFSCLVDADFKDTEAFYAALDHRTVPRDWPTLTSLLPAFTAAFDAHMRAKATSGSAVNRLRGDILAHVRGKAQEAPGLFTLTVPTGGGKTLASLGFALDHARAHGHRRIIYAIPFAGAWIETRSTVSRTGRPDSRPSRRGVDRNLRKRMLETRTYMSPLPQGRGSKLSQDGIGSLRRVAPPAGAWIETPAPPAPPDTRRVAPPAGAWIETGLDQPIGTTAPSPLPQGRGSKRLVLRPDARIRRRPSRRGVDLNSDWSPPQVAVAPSPLPQGRGSKQAPVRLVRRPLAVAPPAGAWIETQPAASRQ